MGTSGWKNEVERDLYLRKVALGESEGERTGYPSIDKPWLKYYSEEHIKAELPYMTAYEYLKKMNAERLDFQAINSEFGNYTYTELFSMIDRTAASLYKMGVQKGKIVLSMFPVLPHESFLLYGVDAVGAAICQLPPQAIIEDVCNAINKFETELFFVFDYLLTSEMEVEIYQNTNIKNIIVVNIVPLQNRDFRTISWEEFIEKGRDFSTPKINRDSKDLLFIASTGGSTGEPKSVMLNDDCFNIAAYQYINSNLEISAGDKWLRLWPIFSASAAVVNHHVPLCTGGNDFLREFPVNMSEFDKMIMYIRPNHIVMIPQLLDVLEKSELLRHEDLSFIKMAGCGGLSITNQFEERVNAFFREHNINTFLGYGWGCTESATSGSMRSSFATTKIGTAGVPMVKTVMSVFDPDDMTEKKYNEEGELCINSKTIMMGYYGDEELSQNVLKIHSDGSTWLHTGDLGSINEDGMVTVKGRMSRMLFVFPTAKIYPQSLETAISKVKGVLEVAICGQADLEHDGFQVPLCVIVPDRNYGAEDVKKNVLEFCYVNFPEHARPKQIYIRQSMPLTKVGKPDIKALEAELQKIL